MPNKTTTKKANNKSSLKKRFDLTNKKVQFFVVIAIVAVLGGGYLTVKSFAATTNTYTARQLRVSNNNCEVNNFGIDPAKNSVPTIDIVCNKGFVELRLPDFPQAVTGLHRACTTVRGGGTISIDLFTFVVTPGSPSTKQTHTLTNDGTYRKYCSGIKDMKNAAPSVTVTVSSPSIAKVSNIEIVPVSAAPAK